MDQEKFAKQSFEIVNAIKTMFTMPLAGDAITYNGVLHMPGGDVEVIVLGYSQTDDPLKSIKPLALLMTPELFDLVDVQAEKIR
jgi:hypothetical protein